MILSKNAHQAVLVTMVVGMVFSISKTPNAPIKVFN